MSNLKDKLKYIDPYFYMDLFINFLHKKGIKYDLLDLFIYVIYSLILAFLLLKFLGLVLGTSEPMMIVVSGSMQPTLNIGDVVVLKSPKNIISNDIDLNKDINGKILNQFANVDYNTLSIFKNNKYYSIPNSINLNIDNKKYKIKKTGDIIVYHSNILKRNIIHRAIFKIKAKDGIYYLTKGDNKETNTLIDEDCHFNNCIKKLPINQKKVIAKYWFKIPYVGYLKIWLFSLFGN